MLKGKDHDISSEVEFDETISIFEFFAYNTQNFIQPKKHKSCTPMSESFGLNPINWSALQDSINVPVKHYFMAKTIKIAL